MLNLTSAALKVFLALDPCDMRSPSTVSNSLPPINSTQLPHAMPSSSSPTNDGIVFHYASFLLKAR